MDIDHPQLSYVAACRDPQRLPADYRGEMRIGDLRDTEYLDRLLVGIDIICHCAGWTSFLNQPRLSVSHYLDPSVDLFNRALEWRVTRFVNLSSVALAATAQRQHDDSNGRPRRGQAMLNCMIGFEDYLKAHSTQRISVINLRAGIYCGRGLQRGLLPLLQRVRLPFYSRGQYTYMPIVDASDLGQAFIRAALAPNDGNYRSFNICGPEQPTQGDVFKHLARYASSSQPGFSVPELIGRNYARLTARLYRESTGPGMTGTLNSLFYNPTIDIDQARQQLGYDPQVNWQASLNDWLQHPAPALDDRSLMQADT